MLSRLKHYLFTSILCLPFLYSAGQDFETQYKSLVSQKDTSGLTNLLQKWESAKPKDPELFIAYFNYYVRKSRTELVSVEKQQKGDESMILADTGTGKTIGYVNSSTNYEGSNLTKAISYIDKGIELYPQRLDMRFGKIYILGESQRYNEFTHVTKEAITYNAKISSQWIWKKNKPVENPKEFFLSSMQDYVMTLYNSGNDQLPLMREIAETILKYYPDHVESLSNIAITYLITNNYDKALEYLFKAEKAAPKDVIVLNNIAEAYHRKKDKINAALYYNKIIKTGTPDEVKDAEMRLKKLE